MAVSINLHSLHRLLHGRERPVLKSCRVLCNFSEISIFERGQ